MICPEDESFNLSCLTTLLIAKVLLIFSAPKKSVTLISTISCPRKFVKLKTFAESRIRKDPLTYGSFRDSKKFNSITRLLTSTRLPSAFVITTVYSPKSYGVGCGGPASSNNLLRHYCRRCSKNCYFLLQLRPLRSWKKLLFVQLQL